MGLKCTLLGHSFDETDVEREREERGSEVVTIVQEVERCSRCGETRVVSENKEVTSIVEPDDVDGATGEETREDAALGEAATDAETAGGYESGSDLDEYEPTADPEDDDAEILEDNRPVDRQPGQWPGDDDEWTPDDLTRDAAGAGQSEPEETDASEAAEAADEPDRGDGAEAADRDDGPTLAAGNDAEGTYVCPGCGYEVEAGDSPFRAGDACPECQAGYLEPAGE
ncbi:DUF7093 family protein [Halorarius halobius]|uniref:DUF7093 family protein n=1 Tax=Halorarius halobius TaxID=2962671 RepID=UPI0020CD720E|nr:hypothetical protein [Halorarius halobius]